MSFPTDLENLSIYALLGIVCMGIGYCLGSKTTRQFFLSIPLRFTKTRQSNVMSLAEHSSKVQRNQNHNQVADSVSTASTPTEAPVRTQIDWYRSIINQYETALNHLAATHASTMKKLQQQSFATRRAESKLVAHERQYNQLVRKMAHNDRQRTPTISVPELKSYKVEAVAQVRIVEQLTPSRADELSITLSNLDSAKYINRESSNDASLPRKET